ncbi:hypothetical protein Nepgr_015629 [Nepenthes gracilis]|uniref:Tetratricopeptide repeat protein 1 n=1 Tax=Nepenthes gracilis TaxID=150966 RepID=A0AAD3SLE8_NEPGR|nr:hypothetical protein Nepgr_015629 [Nepenthes gracilis]
MPRDLSHTSTNESGEEETSSISKDISEGFETASEGDDDKETENDGKEQHEKQQKEEGSEEQNLSPREDNYGDALNDEELKQRALAQANDAKLLGNMLFKDEHYEDALSKYEIALQVSSETPLFTELRSICHSNRAICYLKLGNYEETIKECTKALEPNPAYIKALVRRAEAYEKLERFEEAITDMKKILELDPSNDQARRAIVRLEPLAREKMEKMKEEMIGKLKDMGNSLLGRFGMSIDNFKAVKDPNTGSYSISFQR